MIDDISSHDNAISSIQERKIGLNVQGTGNVQQMLVFTFNLTILLWSFHTVSLMYNALVIENISHLKFKAIITAKDLYFGMKLGMNQIAKCLNTFFGIELCFKQIYPSASRVVIDDC